ncbi:hypothetical protein G6L26_026965 (plasmid) [Agrobacterium radiobacter]|uniref:Transmembrane protein n=1 Tax=Agrobacterium tumefaciens str. B6 TaxID=1183423 RepID=A0A822VDX7_AGRTU|nr:hypothetical protein [Agrobacterium tumefaciens]MQB27934.1 hypothetical protein [Agrobacterium tumefaciens]NTA08291.1 hypothetical protein [Agrobacterium tumefaciens]NTB16113.1 hypothetical protein [Agrobacterium tumefaciens]CVI25325.1 hypothetical protein AGR4A_pAt30140 [Agrobacterium tumefaciens str. B6]
MIFTYLSLLLAAGWFVANVIVLDLRQGKLATTGRIESFPKKNDLSQFTLTMVFAPTRLLSLPCFAGMITLLGRAVIIPRVFRCSIVGVVVTYAAGKYW